MASRLGMRTRMSGITWQQIGHLVDVQVGDVLVFGDDRVNLMSEVEHGCEWAVIGLDQNGNEELLAIQQMSGNTSHIRKDHPTTWIRLPRKRKVKTMSKTAQMWKLLEKTMLQLGKTPEDEHRLLLYGPPGTGKTRLAVKAATRAKQPVYNVYLTEETPAAELRGHYIPTGSQWEWQHGPGVLAPLNGGRLVLNEINNASGDALDLLLAICDDFEMMQMTLPTGETIRPVGGYQIIATMNGEPEDLPPALQDRFVIRAKLNEPHPDAIKRLPEDIRGAFEQKLVANDARFMSVRAWLAFDRLRTRGLTEEQAAELVFESQGKAVCQALLLRRDGKPFEKKRSVTSKTNGMKLVSKASLTKTA